MGETDEVNSPRVPTPEEVEEAEKYKEKANELFKS